MADMGHGQRAGHEAGAPEVLREHGERLLAGGLDDDVEGFGRGDAQLVDGHRMDVLPVGGDHRHLQSRDAHVEVGHRRAVDETQPHLFAGAEDAGPVAERGRAVHQVCVGVAVDVRKVGRRHPHRAPGLAVRQGRGKAVMLHVLEEIAHGPLRQVVVVRHLLQPREQGGRVEVRPVGQQHDVVAVVGERLGLDGVDHERAVQARLFLERRMAVVPVRARLADVKTVVIGLAAVDAVEAQAGHAVHVRGQQDAVPVDRGLVPVDRPGRQVVRDPQVDRRAFAPAQDRCRERAVDDDRRPDGAGEVDWHFADGQVEAGAGQDPGLGTCPALGETGPRRQARDDTACRHALDESAPGQERRIGRGMHGHSFAACRRLGLDGTSCMMT